MFGDIKLWMAMLCAVLLQLVVCNGVYAELPEITQAKQAIDRQDYETAQRLLKPLAQAGDTHAQCLLGEMYEFGYGMPKNTAEALKWYKLAARGQHERRYAIHVVEFGALPSQPKEVKKRLADLETSAAGGDPESQRLLGTLYFKGVGVKRSFKQAFEWFQKSAAQGDADAANDLGFMYQHGAYVQQDYPKAVQFYKQAAAAGDPNAQNNLGFCYMKGLGVPQDYGQAAKLFAQADERGNLDGSSNLGYLYQKGLGVSKDYSKAVSLYAKAAAHGVAAAKYNLGFMYEYGLGVRPQIEKAASLYRLAAAMGYPQGHNDLGFMYDYGGAEPKDYSLALKWYKKDIERKAETFHLVPNFDIYD